MCELMIPFAEVEDPRVDRTKKFQISEILFLALVAALTGVDSFRGIEQFGLDKQDWLKKYLSFENGIPSHQTIGRLFSLLKPGCVMKAYSQFLGQLFDRLEEDIIALDGKTLRRSFDKASGQTPIHILNAWAIESGLSLGQVVVEEKSNEITAVPKLLELIDVHGAIVTADALNTQKDIAAAIIKSKANDSLQVKGNQKTLLENIALAFDTTDPAIIASVQTLDKGHGRIEERVFSVLPVPEEVVKAGWVGAEGIGRVVSTTDRGDKETETISYHLLSFQDVNQYARASRGHWGVENALHWSLDVVFREDEARTRKDHAPANLSCVRKIALSLLRNDTTLQKSVPIKMASAARRDSYLDELLKSSTFR
jgi:predicted transposase YbfD/YdcC